MVEAVSDSAEPAAHEKISTASGSQVGEEAGHHQAQKTTGLTWLEKVSEL